MKHINDLVFTSIQDAKSALECTLSQSPRQALVEAEAVLAAMEAFQYNQPSRCKMLKSIINKANKALKAQQGGVMSKVWVAANLLALVVGLALLI